MHKTQKKEINPHYSTIHIFFPEFFKTPAMQDDWAKINIPAEKGRANEKGQICFKVGSRFLVEADICSCWLKGFNSAGKDIQSYDLKESGERLVNSAQQYLYGFQEEYVGKDKMQDNIYIQYNCDTKNFKFYDYSRNMLRAEKKPFEVVFKLNQKIPSFFLIPKYEALKKLGSHVEITSNCFPYVNGKTIEECFESARQIYSSVRDLEEISRVLDTI